VTESHRGILQVALGASIISFAAVFARISGVDPTISAFYRMLFGGVVLAVIFLIMRPRLSLSRKEYLFAITSGVMFAIDLAVWHRSVFYIGPGLSTLLANFQVFLIAIYGVAILKERLTLRLAVSIPLAVTGLIMIIGIDLDSMHDDYKLGVALALFTALCYTTFLIIFRKINTGSRTGVSVAVMVIVSFSAAVTLGLISLITGENFSIPSVQSATVLITYGIAGQVLGWVLISVGIRKIAASRVGLLLLTQPTLAFVWDILFFSRPTSIIEAFGAVVAIIAIYLGSTSSGRSA